MIKYICILIAFLTMIVVMLKCMFTYNRIVCVFAATLAWSRLYWESVYMCIRGIHFAPIVHEYLLYILELIMIMIEGCAICYFCFSSIIPGTLEDLLLCTYYTLFNTLHWNTTAHIIGDLHLFVWNLCIFILQLFA